MAREAARAVVGGSPRGGRSVVGQDGVPARRWRSRFATYAVPGPTWAQAAGGRRRSFLALRRDQMPGGVTRTRDRDPGCSSPGTPDRTHRPGGGYPRRGGHAGDFPARLGRRLATASLPSRGPAVLRLPPATRASRRWARRVVDPGPDDFRGRSRSRLGLTVAGLRPWWVVSALLAAGPAAASAQLDRPPLATAVKAAGASYGRPGSVRVGGGPSPASARCWR